MEIRKRRGEKSGERQEREEGRERNGEEKGFSFWWEKMPKVTFVSVKPFKIFHLIILLFIFFNWGILYI